MMMNSAYEKYNIHILIPAFNEEHSIGTLLENLNDIGIVNNIFILDDGSVDETAKKSKKNGIKVVKHLINLGQWTALKTLIKISLLENSDYIITMDADGQHLVEHVKQFIDHIILDDVDVVIGSRFLSNDENTMPLYRTIGIRFFTFVINFITGYNLTDVTSGYRCYKSNVIKKILPHLKENQYGILESLLVCSKFNVKIKEIPISIVNSDRSTKGSVNFGIQLLRSIIKSI